MKLHGQILALPIKLVAAEAGFFLPGPLTFFADILIKARRHRKVKDKKAEGRMRRRPRDFNGKETSVESGCRKASRENKARCAWSLWSVKQKAKESQGVTQKLNLDTISQSYEPRQVTNSEAIYAIYAIDAISDVGFQSFMA